MITTSKSAKKTQNLRSKPTVYFSIDDENLPYKGVKGKGFVTIVEDPDRVVPQADRISMLVHGSRHHMRRI
jgi:general stress protein 26